MSGTLPAPSGVPHHVGLHVKSLDRSIEFYEEHLGFIVSQRWALGGPLVATVMGEVECEVESALLTMPGADLFLELIELRKPRRASADARHAVPGTTHICLRVNDLEGLYKRLADAGVTMLSEPITSAGGINAGGRVVIAVDPDGIRLELVQIPAVRNGLMAQAQTVDGPSQS